MQHSKFSLEFTSIILFIHHASVFSKSKQSIFNPFLYNWNDNDEVVDVDDDDDDDAFSFLRPAQNQAKFRRYANQSRIQ